MARESVVLQIFVASPSDVSEERVILQGVVTDLNRVWSNNLGVSFEIIDWEANVRPTFANDPQDAVNTQIGLQYDVFIGIFWGRIGTPTPRAISGSVEEFNRAYLRFVADKDSLEIMLYFKDTPIPPSEIEPDQLKSVQEFKRSLNEKGGLVSAFKDQAGFESSVRAHLSAIAQEFAAYRRARAPVSGDSTMLSTSDTESSDEDDYGYIDYVDIFETQTAEMLSVMNIINEAIVRIGEQVAQRATENKNGSIVGTKATLRFLKRTADDMNDFGDTLRTQVPIFSKVKERAFNALSNALAFQADFVNSNRDDHSLLIRKHGLVSLLEGVTTARNGLSGLREEIETIPRMSKELNKAKRFVVTQLDTFLSEIDSVNSTVINIIKAVDRMTTASIASASN